MCVVWFYAISSQVLTQWIITITIKNYPITIKISLMFSFVITTNPTSSWPHCKLLANINLFSPCVMSFQNCYIDGIKPYITFEIGFFSLSIWPLGSFQVVSCTNSLLFLLLSNSQCMDVTQWLIFVRHMDKCCDQLVNVKIYTAIYGVCVCLCVL